MASFSLHLKMRKFLKDWMFDESQNWSKFDYTLTKFSKNCIQVFVCPKFTQLMSHEQLQKHCHEHIQCTRYIFFKNLVHNLPFDDIKYWRTIMNSQWVQVKYNWTTFIFFCRYTNNHQAPMHTDYEKQKIMSGRRWQNFVKYHLHIFEIPLMSKQWNYQLNKKLK